MHIDINLPDHFEFSSSCKTMPIIIKVSSDSEIELAEKIDVKEVLIKSNSSEESLCGAFIKCHLGLSRETFKISKNKPHFFMFDVFSYDQDCNITPGNYDLTVKIILYIVEESGEFKELTLESKRELGIAR